MKRLFITHLLLLLITSVQVMKSATLIVMADDLEFIPSYFYVNVGDVIKWQLATNLAGNHSTTSMQIHFGAAAWSAPLDATHPNFSYTVNAAGDYDYLCIYDSSNGVMAHFTAFNTITRIQKNTPALTLTNHVIFNGNLSITYWLSAATTTTQTVYDLTGKPVLSNSTHQSEGMHLQHLNIAQLPKGIYILELVVSNSRITRKIILQ